MIDNAKLHIHILHNKTAILQTSINSVVSSCNFSDSLSGNKLLMLVSRLAWVVLQLDLQYTKYMQGVTMLEALLLLPWVDWFLHKAEARKVANSRSVLACNQSAAAL